MARGQRVARTHVGADVLSLRVDARAVNTRLFLLILAAYGRALAPNSPDADAALCGRAPRAASATNEGAPQLSCERTRQRRGGRRGFHARSHGTGRRRDRARSATRIQRDRYSHSACAGGDSDSDSGTSHAHGASASESRQRRSRYRVMRAETTQRRMDLTCRSTQP